MLTTILESKWEMNGRQLSRPGTAIMSSW